MLVMMRLFVDRDEASVWLEGALCEAATHFVSGSPDHLSIVTHLKQIVDCGAVGKIMFLQEPCLGSKHPVGRRQKNKDQYQWSWIVSERM